MEGNSQDIRDLCARIIAAEGKHEETNELIAELDRVLREEDSAPEHG